MDLFRRKLLTIVTESALESAIIKDIKQLGLPGYSIHESKGEGAHGIRVGDWDHARNITVRVVCEESQARQLLDLLYSHYRDFAFFAYMSDVDAIR